MLRTVSGSRCRGVGDPVACGMCRFLGLISAGAFMPVLISIGFPVAAIAVGMRRILIGRFHADCTGRHCEGGGCAACVRKGDASVLYNPLIKHLTSRSIICGQGNRCTFCRFGDFSASAYCSLTAGYGNVVPYRSCKLDLSVANYTIG